MEKVIVFTDFANITASAREAGVEVDFRGLLDYLADPAEGRFLQEAFAYVPVDPRREHAMDRTIQELWDQGFVVKSKVGTIAGQSYKCDFDVEMTLDMVRAAFDMKPDIVVLVSGDSDFVPVVLELRGKGVRVEVASFGDAMSGLLRHRCSGYINLDVLVEGNEGWQDGPDAEAVSEVQRPESMPECEPSTGFEPEPVIELNADSAGVYCDDRADESCEGCAGGSFAGSYDASRSRQPVFEEPDDAFRDELAREGSSFGLPLAR